RAGTHDGVVEIDQLVAVIERLRSEERRVGQERAGAVELERGNVDQQHRGRIDDDAGGAQRGAGVVDLGVLDVERAGGGGLQQPGVVDGGAGLEDQGAAGGVDDAGREVVEVEIADRAGAHDGVVEIDQLVAVIERLPGDGAALQRQLAGAVELERGNVDQQRRGRIDEDAGGAQRGAGVVDLGVLDV